MNAELTSPVIGQAPAKLNLFLNILARRDDGYHEIETVMQRLALHDTLRFYPATGDTVSLRVEHVAPHRLNPRPVDPIPTDERNLIIKAARLLQSHTGCHHGADILLRKRIPSQAGLGGGSSDAATTLIVLNRMWNLNLTQPELMGLAGRIGSDIPFFIAEQGLAVGTGRGEDLQPARGPLMHYVIVKPFSGLSTAEVYANCRISPFQHSAKDVLNALHGPNLAGVRWTIRNALQEPAEQLNPDVRHALSVMRRQDFLMSMMSGSGTACFGVCRSRAAANTIAGRLEALRIGSVFVTHSRV
ncbi:4-(cytidine 5'-diphospho)-2-C-methyl-D-erythritol kinase [Rubinisphaera margarita]|uniref:4-(cytidine 5'-diphospho)-2-C-methyl-D-erythritol kinase n=1 Tax=Rubinisphaera margarita TaxID=2909586 RepID=UPI001EE999F2|nr:4-(cytidine 5'-diphospho)-2-C-methyl-D-erythritol kinase [Rubinisphaera margarita]MCG6155376.1 4-(cytidine 5'-diphospho)-2-C-methyl-D-erythritol kinase [Rubinisphaera margarita]